MLSTMDEKDKDGIMDDFLLGIIESTTELGKPLFQNQCGQKL